MPLRPLSPPNGALVHRVVLGWRHSAFLAGVACCVLWGSFQVLIGTAHSPPYAIMALSSVAPPSDHGGDRLHRVHIPGLRTTATGVLGRIA